MSRARAFVCVSEGVAEEVREHYPAARRPRPHDLQRHRHRELRARGCAARRPARCARRWTCPRTASWLRSSASEWERKGLAALIRALAHAPGWALVVAGEGDEARYRELAQAAGVGEAVRWLGVTRDVPLVYELADAFVLPTSYETFSLVTFEAAASGLRDPRHARQRRARADRGRAQRLADHR